MPVPPDQLARLRAEVDALTAESTQQQRRLHSLAVELQRLAADDGSGDVARAGAAFAKTGDGSGSSREAFADTGAGSEPSDAAFAKTGDGTGEGVEAFANTGVGSEAGAAASARTPHGGAVPPPLPSWAPAAGSPPTAHQTTSPPPNQTTNPPTPAPRPTAPVERWIGQNLLALVGIAILLLGVGIGVRWAIENDYIGPVARIVMGYAVGIALVGFAERLRKAYDTLSAILLGGGMAVLYFVTYAAAAYYDLIPVGVGFAIMTGFTAFTVLAALRYDRQIIAHLGLVGAYAVPFLLSTGGGDWTLMLSYVSVVNLGILAVSFYREWRPLVLVAMVLTWLVFLAMIFETNVSTDPGTGAALALASFNWVLILGALLAPKVRLVRALTALEVAGMLFNGVAYFGIGYYCLEDGDLDLYSGAFALANAAVYLAVALYLDRRARADGQPSRALPAVAAMAVAFVAVAIPIQLDGPWVTVLWAALGTLVMYLSERTALPVLRWGSYGFLLLAVGSLVDDWEYRAPERPIVLNVYFLAAVLVASAFALSGYFQRRLPRRGLGAVALVGLPLVSLALFYLAGYMEIDAYFERELRTLSGAWTYGDIDDPYPEVDLNDYDLHAARAEAGCVWKAFYTLAFALLVAGIEWLWRARTAATTRDATTPSRIPRYVASALLVLGAAAYLGPGLYALSEVRDLYLDQNPMDFLSIDSPHLGRRYLGMALLATAVAMLYRNLRTLRLSPFVERAFELGFHLVILWVLSSELIHQLRMADSEVPYKLGISILWGAYALLLISLGLFWRRAHLRIAAIVLFAVTLVKLFAYDLASLSTVSKTIVLVILGALLLVMSFLYTKFRDRIGGEDSVESRENES